MSDLLAIASSGLRGYRAALEAMGENVANANSDGFARRDVQLRATAPGAGYTLAKPQGGGFGVDVAGLRRAHDAFLAGDARAAQAERARLDATRVWLGEIETTLGSGDGAAGPAITAFYNAGAGVAADPGSTVERNLMLGAAETVAARFRAASASFEALDANLERELGFQVGEVNTLAKALAAVNDRLRRAPALTGISGGLMDERDRLLGEISNLVRVEVREGFRGVATVRLGDGFGPTLVDGGTVARLAVARGAAGLTVTMAKGGADLAGFVTGGSAAGLLAGARQLGRSVTILDGLASDFAATVNAAHMTGVDLAGAPGEAIFATRTVAVRGSPANSGSAALRTELADAAPLSATGYRLRFDAPSGDWTLARADGGASVTGPAALTLDGLTVETSGDAADADLFLIDPKAGAAGLSVRLTDPARVAAADAFIAGHALTNTGSGRVEARADASAALPPLAAWRVRMVTATDFEIVDPATMAVLAPAQPYVAGAWVPGAGFSFRLTGAPAPGDRFDIAASAGASGDAGAIRRLVATRTAPVGLASFEERWDREAGRVSTRLADAVTGFEAAQAADASASAARDARSGVDLDREAADLIRFQQAYQASARVIAAARDLFDTMLGVS